MKWYFGIYLVLWTVAVSAALTNATGLGICQPHRRRDSAIVGRGVHSLIGFAFVWLGGYGGFEKMMKLLVGIMGFSILVCAALTLHKPVPALQGLLMPIIPAGSGTYVLSLIGGVGGSITMLSYNYWMREEKMRGAGFLRYVRGDVGDRLHLHGAVRHLDHADRQRCVLTCPASTLRDAEAVPKMAATLGALLGTFGGFAFSVGFWAAVFASLLGVWQSVPYLYADFYGIVKKMTPAAEEVVEGHEHALSAGARLHHPGADSVRVHGPARSDHRHLHDCRQPVRAVPGRDAALLEQPGARGPSRSRTTPGTPTCCSSRSCVLFVIVGAQEVIGALR